MPETQPQPDVLPIGVLISGGGSTLANLIERIADGRLRNVRIATVISSRSNVAGVQIARDADLPLHVVRKRDLRDQAAFSTAIESSLTDAGVRIVAMAGFLCRWSIPPRFRNRTLNIHPALLPAFGGRGMYGRHVHAAVLAAGQSESGCTVHLADDEYDHGPTIAQRRIPVWPDDTPETLAARVAQVERELYPEVLQKIADEGVAWLDALASNPRN